MRNKSLCAEDRETVITRCDDEDTWTVYSCNEAMKRHLRRIASASGLPVQEIDQWGIQVQVPKSWVKIKRPVLVSDQQKRFRRERALANGFGKKVAGVSP